MSKRTSKAEIHKKFVDAVDEFVMSHSNFDSVPFEAKLSPPLPRTLRVYAYNVTHPPGGRSPGEHKAQLIVPNQDRGQRASFDHSGGYTVLLIGYVPDSHVFVLWDAGLHRNFAYSKNVQVKSKTVYQALGGELGTQVRHLRSGRETVVTSNSHNLADAIMLRTDLTNKRLVSD